MTWNFKPNKPFLPQICFCSACFITVMGRKLELLLNWGLKNGRFWAIRLNHIGNKYSKQIKPLASKSGCPLCPLCLSWGGVKGNTAQRATRLTPLLVTATSRPRLPVAHACGSIMTSFSKTRSMKALLCCHIQGRRAKVVY